jgi:hypothetical protein
MRMREDAADAAESIGAGLGRGSRIVLASFACLFGVGMILMAAPETGSKKLFFYAFGAFCLLIATACVTRGRLRQFAGSVIGCVVFLGSLAYLGYALLDGKRLSSRGGEPSAFNAAVFLLLVGVPGVAYALRERFGYWQAPEDIDRVVPRRSGVMTSGTDRREPPNPFPATTSGSKSPSASRPTLPP